MTQTAALSTHLKQYFAVALFALAVFAIPDITYAGGSLGSVGTPSPMGTVMCAVISIIYGSLGRGLATIAVIVLGVGALIGKVSWGLALTVAAGIGVVFGAVGITSMVLFAVDNPGSTGSMAICYGMYGIN